MSTDYSIVCDDCKVYTHLGQRMALRYSFGFGKNDTEIQHRILKWIANHLNQDHFIKVVISDNEPENYKWIEEIDDKEVIKNSS